MKLILSLALITLISGAHAQTAADKDLVLLSPSEVMTVIGAFPEAGSVEEAADVEALMKFQENRTEEECKIAGHEESANLGSLFGGKNGPLTDKEVKQLSKKLFKSYGQTGVNIFLAKKMFKRPRPYLTHRQIKPCIALESSDSYPSGHSTIARVYARLLSRLYPERAAAFMKRGDQAGLNRLIGGVHYPSDVLAGRKLGDYIAKKLILEEEQND